MQIIKNQKRIGIVGAGIAGLTLAAKLKNHKITIFEKHHSIAGGRTYTYINKRDQNQTRADLGANLIDFDNQQQQQKVRSFLKTIISTKNDKLIPFHYRPSIYQLNQKQQVQQSKPAYFYQNGFKQLISDLLQNIKEQQIQVNSEVIRISKDNPKEWKVSTNQQQYAFDYLVLCCNRRAKILLENSGVNSLSAVGREMENIKYIKQISCAVEVSQRPQFSFISFKQHPITTICSQTQKFPNQPPVVVIQMNQQFSQKYYQTPQEQIVSQLKSIVPPFIQLKKLVRMKKWLSSVLKKQEKYELNRWNFHEQKLMMAGDLVYGSSRVSGAIESALDLSGEIQAKLNASL